MSYLCRMGDILKNRLKLFLSSFVQVLLIAVNTYQVAHEKYIGAVVVGFLISLVWSFNVKRIAIGSSIDRVIYASGAALGTVTGIIISNLVYS